MHHNSVIGRYTLFSTSDTQNFPFRVTNTFTGKHYTWSNVCHRAYVIVYMYSRYPKYFVHLVCTFLQKLFTNILKLLNIHITVYQGWALHSFPFRITFFFWVFGYLWDPKERNVLSRSFQKSGKERKENPVLMQRTGKNAKIALFLYKERERTQERYVLLQKNAECSVLFSIYIYRYI